MLNIIDTINKFANKNQDVIVLFLSDQIINRPRRGKDFTNTKTARTYPAAAYIYKKSIIILLTLCLYLKTP